jgi:hypothetical protein
MTWHELRAWARETFSLDLDEDGAVELTWRFPGERHLQQRERVELAEAFGLPYLLLTCDAVAADALGPREALEHNGTLAVGALALGDGGYVLRHMLPLEGLSPARFARDLKVLAHEAARLRRRAGHPHSAYED